jgi:hypothetical protein
MVYWGGWSSPLSLPRGDFSVTPNWISTESVTAEFRMAPPVLSPLTSTAQRKRQRRAPWESQSHNEVVVGVLRR